MKLILFFIILCIVSVGFHSVDAAKKPINCTIQYETVYCKSKGFKAPDSIGITTPSIPTIPTIPIGTSEARTDIEKLNDTIDLWKKDLIVQNEKIIAYTASIKILEQSFKDALNVEKKAKMAHDNNPIEATRLILVDADKKVVIAKTALDKEVKLKQESVDKVRKLNRSITDSTKILAQSTRELHLSKNKISSNMIGISLSNTCAVLLKNNITTTCPTYATLLALNLDASDKRSGVFSFHDGYYHRGNPMLRNDYKLYDLSDNIIIIDPSTSMSKYIRTITITPNLDTYLLPNDMEKTNNTRIIHMNRYVEACSRAVISADNWLETLSDTIGYMQNGCTGVLKDTTGNVTDAKTTTDISTSAKWKHDKWVKEAKEKYKKSYVGSRENGTNKSTTEDEG